MESCRTMIASLDMERRSNYYLVSLEEVPSGKPSVYAHGFVDALRGKKLEGVAPEYIEGYERGSLVAEGEEEMPKWLTKMRE